MTSNLTATTSMSKSPAIGPPLSQDELSRQRFCAALTGVISQCDYQLRGNTRQLGFDEEEDRANDLVNLEAHTEQMAYK